MLVSAGNLLVKFSRQGENEQVQIALTGEKAVTTALIMLLHQEELRAGDCLTVQQNEPGNRLEIGLGSPSSDDHASGVCYRRSRRRETAESRQTEPGGGPVHKWQGSEAPPPKCKQAPE
jgi:hypothetical protein